MPGANIFLSSEDVTTPPDENGNQLIVCRNINDTLLLRAAFYAYRQLAKLAP